MDLFLFQIFAFDQLLLILGALVHDHVELQIRDVSDNQLQVHNRLFSPRNTLFSLKVVPHPPLDLLNPICFLRGWI